MKKLFLSEELDDSVEVVEVIPSDSEMICSNVINSLIKHEWESIDHYTGALMSLNGNEACQETIMTINQIIEDTYVNIGQLEKLLMGYVPAAEHIDNVELDATELLNVNNDAISVEEQL